MSRDVGDLGNESVEATDPSPGDCRRATLANAVADGLFQVDADDRLVAVNDAFLDAVGRSREEVLGEPLDRAFPAADADRLSAAWRNLADSDPETATVTASLSTADGERSWEVRLRTLDGADGGAAGSVSPTDPGRADGSTAGEHDDSDRTEARLREETEKFRSLVDAVEEYAIFTLDPDGRVTSWNPGAARIKGYDADEVVGEHFSIFYTEADRAAGVPGANLEAAAADGGVDDEGWRVREDGTRFWANVTITPIRDDEGELTGYAKVTRDMTDRKEREEALRRERDLVTRILEANPVGIAVVDDSEEVVRLNEAGADVLGVDSGEAADLDPDDWTIYDEDGDRVPPDEWPQSRALRTGEPVFDWRCEIECRDGTRRWISANAVPLFDGDDAVERVILTANDVTRLKEQTRELARERDELETELEDVFGRVSDAFFALDEAFRFTYVNDRAEQLLDREEAALLGTVVREAFPGAVGSTFQAEFERAMETQQPVSFEEYFPPLSTWFEVNAYPSETGLSVYFRDVTDRVERERQLEQHRAVSRAASDGIVVIDEENTVVSANPAVEEILGYDPEDLAGEPITALMSDSMADDHRESLARYLETGERTLSWDNVELPGRHRDGHEVPLAVSINEFEFGDERYFAGVVRDVTDRQEMERKLRESEAKFRMLAENLEEVVWMATPDTSEWIYVNPAFEDVWGRSREGLYEEPLSFLEAVHPDDRERVRAAFTALPDSDFDEEFRIVRPDGEVRWIHTRGREVYDEEGETARVVGIGDDVTERVERERALEESERRYRTLAENFPDGAVGVYDHDLRYTLTEGAVLGAELPSADRMEGSRLPDLFPAETVADLEPLFRGAVEDGETGSTTTEFGGRHWRVWTTPLEDADGEIFAGLSFAQDVTEQKEREQYLEDAKAQLEAATEAGAVGTWEWHVPEDRFVAGAALAKRFGIDPDAARKGVALERLISSIHEDDRERVEAEIEAALESCGEYESEYRVRNADDELRWVVARGHVECENGEPVTFPGALTDITERKRAERQLQRNNEQLESLFEILPVGVVVADEDGRLIEANNTAKEIWGGDVFDADSVEEYETESAVWADSGEPVAPDEWTLSRVLDGEEITDSDVFEIEAADGERRIVRVEGMPVRNVSGEVTRGVITMTDVTDRLERKRELETYETIVKTVEDGVYVLDEEFHFEMVNDAYVEMTGYDREELLGEHPSLVIDEDVSAESAERLEGVASGEASSSVIEADIHRADGGRLRAESKFTAIPSDDSGQPRKVGVVRDITDRLERERELERYETIVETVNDGIYVVDEDGRFTMVNDEYAAMTGRSREDLLGQHVTEVVDEEVARRARQLETGLVSGDRDSASLEAKLETNDDETVVAEAAFALLPSGDGHERIGVVRDVTERRERERALEESERRYRTLAENFPDGVVALFDEDLRFTAAGGQLFDQVGTGPDDPIGHRLTERYPPDLVEEIEPHFHAALAGETTSFEVELDGWHLHAYTLPVRDADDEVYAVMLVVQNVTELREHERELQTRVSQQEAVTDLGQQALEERDLDALFEEVTDCVVEVLDADYCKVLELLPDGEEVLLRSGVGWQEGLVGEATVNTGLDSQAGYTLSTEDPVIVDDLATETRFSGPDLLVDHDVTSGISVVVGTAEDPWGVLGVHATDERDFTEHDVNFVQSVATILATAIQRADRERDLELYETIVENIWDGVYALDPDGNFELVNEAFASMLDYDREQLLSEPASTIHSEGIDATARQLAEQALEGDDEAVTMEVELTTGNDDGVPVETRFGPYPYDGERYGRTGVSRDVTERLERERALERQREELAALNRLNQVVGEIIYALVESSSREEIERLVCERLADSESYRFAWIGEADRTDGTLALRAEAGVEGYLDDVTLTVDPEDGVVGPTGLAARTGEPQITRDIETDSDYGPWREHALEYGFRSSAAIPITYEDVPYGVLNVYSERPGAFDGYERTLLVRLGNVVGHTINALERKEALMSDQIQELEFEMRDIASLADGSLPTEGTITFERTVSVGHGTYLQYGTADETAVALLEELVASVAHWEDVTILDERFGEVGFELQLSEPPAISTVASYGGRVRSAAIEGGDHHMEVELPSSADVRAVVEALKAEYPDIELIAQRRTARDERSARGIEDVLEEQLTDRQRATLEATYYAGYFDTPRMRSGEEVADSLGITAPTLHQHLRKGQRKLLATVFDGPEE